MNKGLLFDMKIGKTEIKLLLNEYLFFHQYEGFVSQSFYYILVLEKMRQIIFWVLYCKLLSKCCIVSTSL